MSFLTSIFKREDTGNPDSVGKVASEVAVDIIKKLSGEHIRQTKKVIDNIVIFSNAAGGTGASTIVTNVASIANNMGLKVLIIDLNIMFPIQQSYTGLKLHLERPDLVSYLLGKNILGQSIDSTGKISVIYANNRTIMDSINCESDIAVENFSEALDKVRQLFDLVLIDAPMKIDHTLVNTAFYTADQIYLVWDEGLPSIANTEKIRRNMGSTGIDAYTKMRVVLNKRTNIHYSNYPFQKLNIELSQVLPFDTEIIESSLRSLIFCDKGSSSSINSNAFYNGIVNLTEKILEYGGYVK